MQTCSLTSVYKNILATHGILDAPSQGSRTVGSPVFGYGISISSQPLSGIDKP